MGRDRVKGEKGDGRASPFAKCWDSPGLFSGTFPGAGMKSSVILGVALPKPLQGFGQGRGQYLGLLWGSDGRRGDPGPPACRLLPPQSPCPTVPSAPSSGAQTLLGFFHLP